MIPSSGVTVPDGSRCVEGETLEQRVDGGRIVPGERHADDADAVAPGGGEADCVLWGGDRVGIEAGRLVEHAAQVRAR